MTDFPLFPEQASTFAGPIDTLYWVLIALSLLFGGVLPFIILFLMVRYHRSNQTVDRTNQVHSNLKLELTWTIIPLVLVLGVFFWGAFLYVQMRTPPQASLEVYVIGKQWMWHAQHPNGKRENNELHVPIGRPVRLIMTSQDVIHSFYIPAFRVKQDVLPGRYTTMWFEATQEGEYHLFCAEYCGTEHAKMGGRVVAMSVADYERWLVTPGEVILPDGSVGAAVPSVPTDAQGDPMALVGQQLFVNQGCAGCHRDDGAGTGPSLQGLYLNQNIMADGSQVLADEAYLAESILNPQALVVRGYGPPSVMPAYEGRLSEDQVNQLIAYIKSLSDNADASTDGGDSDGGEATTATADPANPTPTPETTPEATPTSP
jgi:cytochrome c oxidase subunit 2